MVNEIGQPVKIFLRKDYGSFGQVVSTGEAQPADDVWATRRSGTAAQAETFRRSTAMEQVRSRERRGDASRVGKCATDGPMPATISAGGRQP
jgi:hypothetical protein